MKANELMIADWVQSELYGTQQISFVAKSEHEWYNYYNDGLCCDHTEASHPIPLTAEILEMNGMEHPLPKIEYYDMLAEGKQLVIEKSLERWHIRYGGCSNYVSNVHELQHALRLCGLNDLADNFKV